MAKGSRVVAGRAWRLPAILVLATAAMAISAGAKDDAAQKITPQILDALAHEYLDAGLPLPPPDAPLMLIQSGVTASPGRKNVTIYVVGFKIPPDGEGNSTERFLMGTQRGDAYQTDGRVPAMRPLDTAKALPTDLVLEEQWAISSSTVFPVNNWLALAVQCHLRGYDRVAEQIFARGLAADPRGVQRLTPVGDGHPRDSLAATAWNHWMNTLCIESTDRREILAHLEKLSARFPALDGPFQRDYLASLRLAMGPGKDAPDSLENLVDTLVDHTGYGGMPRTDTNDPVIVRLQNLGFAAVPALIAHLDDRRLTRSVLVCEDAVRFHPRRVNEVVSDLLEDIAGPDGFPRDPTGSTRQGPIDKEAVERWWTQASATGEETYMVSRVFPPSEVSLPIVAERYPRRLGEIYTRLLKEKPEVDCQAILMAISTCEKLAREERRRLLHEGLASPDTKCNFEAIGALLEFEQADAEAALIDKLGRWPADLAGPYDNVQRPEMLVGNYVAATDSAEVWQAYERALFRATTAFRMEMLKWLADTGSRGVPQDVRKLAVLELFLDDEEVRVISKKDEAEGGRFEGYALTADTRRISVRNFVAGLLGPMLDVKPPPGKVHDEHWWAKYRADAHAAIDRLARAAAEAPATEEE